MHSNRGTTPLSTLSLKLNFYAITDMKTIKGLLLTISISLIAMAGVKASSTPTTIKDNIFTAIRSIDYTSINVLLSEGTNVDTVDEEGNTPLMIAAKTGNLRIMDILLNHNPNINLQNKNGSTALIMAAKTGQLHVVKKLIRNGADTTMRDGNGNTALTLASKFGHHQVVTFLETIRTQEPLAK